LLDGVNDQTRGLRTQLLELKMKSAAVVRTECANTNEPSIKAELLRWFLAAFGNEVIAMLFPFSIRTTLSSVSQQSRHNVELGEQPEDWKGSMEFLSEPRFQKD